MDFEVLPELKEVKNAVINYMIQFRSGAFTLPDTNGLFTLTHPVSNTDPDSDHIPVVGTKGPLILTSQRRWASLSLMVHLHCRRRTQARIRIRIPNPMAIVLCRICSHCTESDLDSYSLFLYRSEIRVRVRLRQRK